MNILFPSDPKDQKQINLFFQKESEAAAKVGFEISLLGESHFDSPASIFNHKAPSLYRGWIVKPIFYQEMDQLGAGLVNSYQDYLWSYNFPEWYQELKQDTPYSLIFPANDIVKDGLPIIADKVAKEFQGKSIMIKDYLKSRKAEWYDACFIRDTSDQKESLRVLNNFFNLQGQEFYGGLVCREFLQLKTLGFHPKARMPLPLEFRTFFLRGEAIFTTPYWNSDISYPESIKFPPPEWLKMIGQKIKSPFVALDIVQAEDERWHVIEINDGGGSGLPSHVNLEEFYQTLKNRLT